MLNLKGLAQNLVSEWKDAFTIKNLKTDFFSGLTVTTVAVPLSLAIALASGVKPEVGLTTAIIGGIVCAIFGGTRLSVSGPAAAMAILVATTIQNYGMSGLIFITLGCGILQLLTGLLGFGRFSKFVPMPVVAGFTAGIGAIILIGQIPRALGLPPPDQSHIFDVITHLNELIHTANPLSVAVTLLTVVLIYLIPRVNAKWPAILLAVAIPTALVSFLGISTERIGTIPRNFPPLEIPSLPTADFASLLGTIFIFYALASLETLLSCSAVDKMVKGTSRHDPNQEMIGQGLANMVSPLFGGIPITGVIARSGINVQAGAQSRLSSLIHAVFIFLAMISFASLLEQIPIATLAGVLITVSFRMMNVAELKHLVKTSKSEAAVYGITFLTIVFVDLIAGVQAGVVAALIILAIRVSQTQSILNIVGLGSPIRLSLSGAITFMSSNKFGQMRESIRGTALRQRSILIDMSDVTHVDVTGAELFLEFIGDIKKDGWMVAVKGLSLENQRCIQHFDSSDLTKNLFSETELDAHSTLNHPSVIPVRERLMHGVHLFQRKEKKKLEGLFNRLSVGQQPHTLFVTCCDSRIVPNLITSTDPGELFLLRNIGNIVPPFGTSVHWSEGAAIEYAVDVLQVRDIIICGHTGCGAMNALFRGEIPNAAPALAAWKENVLPFLRSAISESENANELARKNTLLQLEHLKSYPTVSLKLAVHSLKLHAWYYDIQQGGIEEWNERTKIFTPLSAPAETGSYKVPSRKGRGSRPAIG